MTDVDKILALSNHEFVGWFEQLPLETPVAPHIRERVYKLSGSNSEVFRYDSIPFPQASATPKAVWIQMMRTSMLNGVMERLQ